MKILVIEDKKMHQESARETLNGHDVTILTSFDEGATAMSRQIDEAKVERLLAERGIKSEWQNSGERSERSAYWQARGQAQDESVIPFSYEVVLVDMMMPMSSRGPASGAFRAGEQVPYGFVLALQATLCGAKFVAMVTDTNHHKGAMSAAIDHLGSAYYEEGFRPNFVINGAKVMFVHAPFVEDPKKDAECYNCLGGTACAYCRTTLKDGKCSRCKSKGHVPEPCHVCGGKGKHDTTVHERKDWGQVLKDLLGEPTPVTKRETPADRIADW